MPAAPKNILYVRPDTFGDLVLFEPALRELIAVWPNARHTLLVRPGYESLAPLFSSNLRWRVAPLNPFSQSPSEGRAAFDALLRDLQKDPPDLIVGATLNRTWLEVALAARLPAARSVALGTGRVDPLFTTALALEFGATTADSLREQVEIDPAIREWENNLRLVDHLLGRKVARTAPSLSVPADRQAAADQWLAQHKLPAGRWVALFPAGVANVKIKAWSPAGFAETAAWLQREHQLPVALLGHTSEAAILEEVAAGIARLGQPQPPVWLGRDGEIDLLAALLRNARLYFGHDTGAMHIAAALGRPIAAIFGGGHWPRFQPVARQAVSVIQPLPCFGCNWDCHFGDAPCVKTLQVADAQAALTKLVAAGDRPLETVYEAQNVPAGTLQLIAAATPRYRRLQRDRLDRQYKIEELTHLGREKDVEIADLKRAADERKREMEAIKTELEAECAQKDTEIGELKAEADTKDDEINSLKAETNTKDAEIASLKAEADTKDVEINSLKAEANTKDAEIEQLKATCNEREALIFKLTDIVKDFQRQVADLSGTVAAREAGLTERDVALRNHEAKLHDMARALQERDERLATVTEAFENQRVRLASLPADASHWAQSLYDKDVHIRNIESMLADRDNRLREQQATIGNLEQGLGELEQAKRYGKWLHEKEAVIQQLKRACDDREALIRQLAAQAAGLGRVRQATLAVTAYLRQKWWQRLRDWTFKKVVDDYWMQLGVLQHYEPRPIQWDLKLPNRGRLPEPQLPVIVIVTPSYNQDKFLESTILSVLNQNYPKLRYRVQDGGSKDRSPEIIQRYADRLAGWYSGKDRGQSDAIRRGFDELPGDENDIMAWLNSDDFIAPRALRFVAEYFVQHPHVDVIYGHRIIIDDQDREVGRWIMPPHDPRSLEWIDYVPQETLFFRRRAWNAVGGLDPTFQFALDWDLIARFQEAGARIVRLPYFLGCFRVHTEQKTSAHIHTTGHEEMNRIRTRIHGPHPDPARIEHYARKSRFRAAVYARLHALGLRF